MQTTNTEFKKHQAQKQFHRVDKATRNGNLISKPEEIVVYDGDCGICTALTIKISAIDRHQRLRFMPYQNPDWQTLLPGVGPEQARNAVFFRTVQGRVFAGAAAIFQIMQRLPGCWRTWGRILAFPLCIWVAEPVYRLIANHRAQISRWLGLASCRIDDRPA